MGALHINGQKITGLDINLAEGVFIDTDNVIVSKTSYTPSTFSYTATEDCVLYIEIPAQGGYSTFLEIDGKEVQGVNLSGSGTNYLITTAFLKQGQTATLSSSSFPSVTPDYAVYGIQQGTIEGKLQPVIYSLDEREVGVWTDGKPLYQKTVHISALPSTAYADTQYAHNISNIDKIISWKGFTAFANGSTLQFDRSFSSSTYEGNTGFSATVDKTAINVRVGTDRSAMSADFTIQYTKTTDTAGAGTWTPDGAYAQHYSTDERVIGTWIDGSTIYEKTFDLGSDVTIGRNNFSTVTGLQIPNVSMVLDCNGMKSNGTLQGKLLVSLAEYPAIQMQTPRNGADALCQYLTIQYTKSTS